MFFCCCCYCPQYNSEQSPSFILLKSFILIELNPCKWRVSFHHSFSYWTWAWEYEELFFGGKINYIINWLWSWLKNIIFYGIFNFQNLISFHPFHLMSHILRLKNFLFDFKAIFSYQKFIFIFFIPENQQAKYLKVKFCSSKSKTFKLFFFSCYFCTES